MRIVYILPAASVCGGVRTVFEHCDRLRARGHDTQIATAQAFNKPSWYDLHTPLIPLSRLSGHVDALVATHWTTHETVRAYPHASGRFHFVQMIESFFEARPEYAARAEAVYEPSEVKPYVLTKWGKRWLEEKHGQRDVPIIMNGVNQTIFHQEAHKDDGVIWLMTEGHQGSPAKDTDGMTWKVALAAQKMRRNMTIKTQGYASTAHRFASSFNYWRTVPQPDVLRMMYNRSYLLIKASRYDFLAGACVEAMCCGAPTVRALITGDDDLIDGYNCLRCGYDQEELLTLTLKMLDDRDLRNELARNGLVYAREHLQWDDKIDQLERLYAS